MSQTIQVRVPDIGSEGSVPVIEVLVAVGDQVDKDQGLITLESDKATMEIPASHAGVVQALHVALGDTVGEGDLIVDIETAAAAEPAERGTGPGVPEETRPQPAATPEGAGKKADQSCQVLVLGAGPGGYTAAFRAADLGQQTILVERYPTLGGVCLNVGCIPSKALLHAAGVVEQAAALGSAGITFGAPRIDLDALRSHTGTVVDQLTQGLAGMARKRKVKVMQGEGRFISANELEVHGDDGVQVVRFEKAIIATGSRAVKLPGLPWDDPRLMDSTDALQLPDIPPRLLLVGGGIIGLEMACVYSALGSEVTIVELLDQLVPGADADLVRPLQQRLGKRCAIHLQVKVTGIEAAAEGLHVTFSGDGAPAAQTFDRVLVAVGRTPNGGAINAQAAGVEVDDRGFIAVNRQMQTNVPHIFAIGDVVGQPMLAHKASHEGKVAAEVAAGLKSELVARVIPSVAYTDPEMAWVGVTEAEAKKEGIAYGVGKFPWAASGRAIGIGRTEGFTKLLFDPQTNRIIGAGIVGPHAGDLIAELALAIEMGAEAEDIALTIHPHPTLSETVGMAAEAWLGTITDLYMPKRG